MAGFRVINFIAVRSFLVLTILPYGGFPKSGFHSSAVHLARTKESPRSVAQMTCFAGFPTGSLRVGAAISMKVHPRSQMAPSRRRRPKSGQAAAGGVREGRFSGCFRCSDTLRNGSHTWRLAMDSDRACVRFPVCRPWVFSAAETHRSGHEDQ